MLRGGCDLDRDGFPIAAGEDRLLDVAAPRGGSLVSFVLCVSVGFGEACVHVVVRSGRVMVSEPEPFHAAPNGGPYRVLRCAVTPADLGDLVRSAPEILVGAVLGILDEQVRSVDVPHEVVGPPHRRLVIGEEDEDPPRGPLLDPVADRLLRMVGTVHGDHQTFGDWEGPTFAEKVLVEVDLPLLLVGLAQPLDLLETHTSHRVEDERTRADVLERMPDVLPLRPLEVDGEERFLHLRLEHLLGSAPVLLDPPDVLPRTLHEGVRCEGVATDVIPVVVRLHQRDVHDPLADDLASCLAVPRPRVDDQSHLFGKERRMDAEAGGIPTEVGILRSCNRDGATRSVRGHVHAFVCHVLLRIPTYYIAKRQVGRSEGPSLSSTYAFFLERQ